jgi:hypothetical protein
VNASPPESPQPGQSTVPSGLLIRQAGLGDASIIYDEPPRRAAPNVQARDLEIMRALWRYDVLTTSQIGVVWWPGRHPSRAQVRLAELTAAGLLARFRPLLQRGTHKWIYQLARDGFRLAQRCYGTDGAYIDEEARWTERRAVEMRRVEHDLRVNAWMLSYRHLVGRQRMVDWLGRREARVEPVGAGEATPGITPGAAALLALDLRSAPLEILVELVRDERPVRLAERLRRYDGLLGDWWPSVPRFRSSERPPAAMFIAPSYRAADNLIRVGDEEFTSEAARSRVLFSAEPDIQRGSLRAWMLPETPPELRASNELAAREVTLPGHA